MLFDTVLADSSSFIHLSKPTKCSVSSGLSAGFNLSNTQKYSDWAILKLLTFHNLLGTECYNHNLNFQPRPCISYALCSSQIQLLFLVNVLGFPLILMADVPLTFFPREQIPPVFQGSGQGLRRLLPCQQFILPLILYGKVCIRISRKQ